MPTFEELYEKIHDALRSYHEDRAYDTNAPWFASSVQTNTTYVAERFGFVKNALMNHAGIESLSGLSMLDAGTGFGTMLIYIALTQNIEKGIGLDLNDGFLESAKSIVRDLPELQGTISFQQGDMRNINLDESSFDFVLCNNAILYFTEDQDFHAALSSFYRVLKPGGAVVVYYPNRWYPKEQFTGLPLIQFLPRRLADRVVKVTNRRSGYMDVRMRSPLEFQRHMAKIGFEEIAHTKPRGTRSKAMAWKDWFSSYLIVVAKRPAE